MTGQLRCWHWRRPPIRVVHPHERCEPSKFGGSPYVVGTGVLVGQGHHRSHGGVERIGLRGAPPIGAVADPPADFGVCCGLHFDAADADAATVLRYRAERAGEMAQKLANQAEATAALQAAALDSSITAIVADGLWPKFEDRAREKALTVWFSDL